MTTRRTLTIISALALVAAGGVGFALLGSNGGPEAPTKPAPVVAEPKETSPEEFVIDVAPGESIESLNGGPELPETSPDLGSLSEDESDLLLDPEKKPASNPGVKPEGFTVPKGGELKSDASKFDGYYSHVVVLFAGDWESTVGLVRSSLESSGWTCKICMPFKAAPGIDPKFVAGIKYKLTMIKDGHEVVVVVGPAPVGSTASYNFQG